MSMHAAELPDVSLSEAATRQLPLQWVGMQGIDLPVTVREGGVLRQMHAHADVQVDLPAAHVKGIHMSRLYRRLDALSDGSALSPALLRRVLEEMVETHADCDSTGARLRVRFDLLVRRSALVTKELSGWKSYPVRVDALLSRGVLQLRTKVMVTYSSTCPCSAALARQLIEQGFRASFAEKKLVDCSAVTDWLREHATLATPHSQRSEAEVEVDVPESASELGLLALIDATEDALSTPVQTAVKRPDEQAFAALNGQNLMFVEDAARRVQSLLSTRMLQPRVLVRHLESLHPHDAVAFADSVDEGVTT